MVLLPVGGGVFWPSAIKSDKPSHVVLKESTYKRASKAGERQVWLSIADPYPPHGQKLGTQHKANRLIVCQSLRLSPPSRLLGKVKIECTSDQREQIIGL